MKLKWNKVSKWVEDITGFNLLPKFKISDAVQPNKSVVEKIEKKLHKKGEQKYFFAGMTLEQLIVQNNVTEKIKERVESQISDYLGSLSDTEVPNFDFETSRQIQNLKNIYETEMDKVILEYINNFKLENNQKQNEFNAIRIEMLKKDPVSVIENITQLNDDITDIREIGKELLSNDNFNSLSEDLEHSFQELKQIVKETWEPEIEKVDVDILYDALKYDDDDKNFPNQKTPEPTIIAKKDEPIEPVHLQETANYIQTSQSNWLEKMFLVITIIGATADMAMIAGAFHDINIQMPLLALFNPDNTMAMNLNSGFAFFLALIVCFLTISFAFKAGSMYVDNNKKQTLMVTMYEIVWGSIGLVLVFLRLSAEYIKQVHNNVQNPTLFNMDGPSMANYVLAIMLLVLYVGTGISAWNVGVKFGNTQKVNFNKLRNQIVEEFSEIRLKCAQLRHFNIEFNNLNAKIKYAYKEIIAVKARKQKEIDILVFEEVVCEYRKAGIVINDDLLKIGDN